MAFFGCLRQQQKAQRTELMNHHLCLWRLLKANLMGRRENGRQFCSACSYIFFLFFLVGHSVFASYYYNFMLSLYLDCYVWPSFASSPQLPFLYWIGLYLTNIHNPHASPGYLYRNPNYLFVVNCSVNNMKIRFILTTNVHKIVCPTRQIRRPFQNRSISTLST